MVISNGDMGVSGAAITAIFAINSGFQPVSGVI
jgi:hypothetical protein